MEPAPKAHKSGVNPVAEAMIRDAERSEESRLQRFLRDPEYLLAYREKRRSQLDDRRDDMIRILGFTPKEADAVVELLVDRQVRTVMRPTTVLEATPEGLRQIQEQEDAEERDYQAQIRARVGEDKRARLENYLGTMNSRLAVDALRSELSGADALRDDQMEPLIEALHAESTQYETDLHDLRDTQLAEDSSPEQATRYRARKLELLKDYQRREHVAASSILTTGQLRRFDESMQRILEREVARQRVAQIEDKLDPAQAASGQ